jgi:DNA-binding Lrp family transcriptional regulator
VLTTNDVRVLRLLIERGPLTASEISSMCRYGFGASSALRRLPKLVARGMVRPLGGFFEGAPMPPYDATVEGVRALRAADVAAYGRFAR